MTSSNFSLLVNLLCCVYAFASEAISPIQNLFGSQRNYRYILRGGSMTNSLKDEQVLGISTGGNFDVARIETEDFIDGTTFAVGFKRRHTLPLKTNVELVPNLDDDSTAMANKSFDQAFIEDMTETGVRKKGNGYCFGRQSVVDAIAAIKRGELVVVVDDENRENEGDLIMASDLVTPELMATMVRHTSGVLCVALEADRLKYLKLPSMVKKNQDPKGTAFTISVDAAKKHGITTGISAADRATTIRLLADPCAVADDFVRPGHIFPLRARRGGTITRDGHTEAAVDLSRLAGLNPSGVLCEIVSEENPVEMARLPELKRFCKTHGFVMTSIVDIAQYIMEEEGRH